MRLSEVEAARMQLVADHHGLSISDAIRMLFKHEADAIERAVLDRVGVSSERRREAV